MTSRALLAGLCLLAGGCLPTPEPESADTPPEVTLFGVQMTHYRGPQVAATGRSARVTYRRSSGEMVAYETFFRFPSRHAKVRRNREPPSMEVRAPVVVGNLGAKTAEGQGGVIFRGSTGITGKTERVTFDGRAFTGHSETRTAVVGPGYTLDADRFTLLFEPEEFTFEGDVQSRLGGAK